MYLHTHNQSLYIYVYKNTQRYVIYIYVNIFLGTLYTHVVRKNNSPRETNFK